MTALVLAAAGQPPKDSDFSVAALSSVAGLTASSVLLRFGIDLG